MQEHFHGERPMTVEATAREALGEELRQRLASMEGVESRTYYYPSEQEKARLVYTFRLTDSRFDRYSYSGNDLRLQLSPESLLTITDGYEARAVVSDLDEIVAFVLHCKQRLARLQALQARREKVRHLQAQAIMAQVKQLAKEERFDFMTSTDSQKVKLFVRLSPTHSLEIHIPFKRFQETLPQLRTVIVSLRTLCASGVQFKVVSRRALPWGSDWVLHTSL